MCYNLFGYLPAPTIYGMVNKDEESRNGMMLILYASIPAVSLIGLAVLIRQIKKPIVDTTYDEKDVAYTPRKHNNVNLGPEPSLIGVGITDNF